MDIINAVRERVNVPRNGGWCESRGVDSCRSLQYSLSLLSEEGRLRENPFFAQLLMVFQTLSDNTGTTMVMRRLPLAHQIVPSRQYQLLFSISRLPIQLECLLRKDNNKNEQK